MQMLPALFCAFLSIAFASSASADPLLAKASGKKKTKKANTEEADEQEQDEQDATAEPKNDRPTSGYGVGGNVALLMAGGQGLGIDLWRQAPDLQYGLHLMGTKGEVKGGDDEDEEGLVMREVISTSAYTLQAKARKFFGGSFYLTGGLGYTFFSGEYGFESSGGEAKADYEGSAFIAHFGLGNQWHLGDGMVIGCDWIGLAKLFGTSVSADDSDDAETVDAMSQFFFGDSLEERLEESMDKVYGAYALLLTVGKVL